MKKTILITAYAVNPYKGSEDGTGWNISKEISKEYKTVIVTRKNNRQEIERYLKNNTNAVLDNMSFLYYDLPEWAMRAKKKLGERGYVLYFYLWQFFMPWFILKSKVKFDLSYVLNFHSDSTPHFLWLLGKPVIWGPIGHHPKISSTFLFPKTWNVILKNHFYHILKWGLRNLDPFFYLAKARSNKIIGINSSVQSVMRVKDTKFRIIPAVGSAMPMETKGGRASEFLVLSVGRFTAIKGFDVTIRSFSRFFHSLSAQQKLSTKLMLVGKGEELDAFRRLIKELRIEKVVEIVSWVPKHQMEAIYANASVFLFPSHEGAGMVIPEAMSFGLPVVCFDNVGPGELVGDSGLKVPYTNYNESINSFARYLKQLFENPDLQNHYSNKSLRKFKESFTWEHKGREIRKEISELLSQPKTVAVFHPSAELYGADRILANALKALPQNVVKRVYLFRNGPLVKFLKDNVSNIEVVIQPQMPVIYRDIFNLKGIVGFAGNWFKFLTFLRLEHKKYAFSSAYINTLSCSFVLPTLYLLRVKRFVHVHEIIETPKIAGSITARLSFLFAQRIVCVSQAVCLGLKNYVPKIESKTEIIHNGIDPILVDNTNHSKALNFYLFGRIKPEKGQWYLMEALSRIPKSILANNQFVLMGGPAPGQEEIVQELKLRIKDLGLDQNVRIEGFSANISLAMSMADVCLVPSIMKDPFPTTVLEAMSAAKTVISTNHGGASEAVVNKHTGFLIPPGDSNEFAKAIMTVLKQKNNLSIWGQNAKKRYDKLFTTDIFNHNWFAFQNRNQFL